MQRARSNQGPARGGPCSTALIRRHVGGRPHLVRAAATANSNSARQEGAPDKQPTSPSDQNRAGGWARVRPAHARHVLAKTLFLSLVSCGFLRFPGAAAARATGPCAASAAQRSTRAGGRPPPSGEDGRGGDGAIPHRLLKLGNRVRQLQGAGRGAERTTIKGGREGLAAPFLLSAFASCHSFRLPAPGERVPVGAGCAL